MEYIHFQIKGIPYSKGKSRGKKSALHDWKNAIIDQTRDLPKVNEACLVKVTFQLPPDKFPKDFPYGPDLDNLLKLLLDALGNTVLSKAPGKDSCIISLTVLKTRVKSSEEAGAHLEVLPFMFAQGAA